MNDWRRWLPHPALVFVVVAWGLNFSLIKLVLEEMEPSVAAFLRYVVMMGVLYASCLALGIPLQYPTKQRARFIFAGFLANGFYMILFVEGMRTAGAAQGAIVLATAPVWVALFAILKKQEAFTAHMFVGGMLAFGGAVLTIVSGRVGEGDVVGALLVLASAVVWAWSVVLMRPLVVEGSPYGVFTLTFPGGAIALLPYTAFMVWRTGGKELTGEYWASISAAAWWSLAYLVIIAGVGAFAAYYKGLADVGPTKTSMTQFFITPTAALFAWVAFGGEFVLMQAVGMAVVVLGTLVASGRLWPGHLRKNM
jgi:drug/metabolite transporter (DMT)-like permease